MLMLMCFFGPLNVAGCRNQPLIEGHAGALRGCRTEKLHRDSDVLFRWGSRFGHQGNHLGFKKMRILNIRPCRAAEYRTFIWELPIIGDPIIVP